MQPCSHRHSTLLSPSIQQGDQIFLIKYHSLMRSILKIVFFCSFMGQLPVQPDNFEYLNNDRIMIIKLIEYPFLRTV